jgi:Sec7-like guanine-nucleotide exchange factor
MACLTRGSPAERIEFTFKLFDYDKSGSLDVGEVKNCVAALGVSAHVRGADIAKHITETDIDGSCSLDIAEFTHYLVSQKGVRQEMAKHAAAAAFNLNPSEGVEMVQESFLKDCRKAVTPENLAELFVLRKESKRFNSRALGEYLSGPDDDCRACLKEVLNQLDFRLKPMDKSLRKLMSMISLPFSSEEKMGRLVEAFAAQYNRQNPRAFKCRDAAFVLAYSIIMLNADLHDGQCASPMSRKDFVQSNQGIDGGKDLGEGVLPDIYDRIEAAPLDISTQCDRSVLHSLVAGTRALGNLEAGA